MKLSILVAAAAAVLPLTAYAENYAVITNAHQTTLTMRVTDTNNRVTLKTSQFLDTE